MVVAIIIAAIIVSLGYFGINIQRDIIGNPTIQSNFTYLYKQGLKAWDTYIKSGFKRTFSWISGQIENLPVGSDNGINIPQIDLNNITAETTAD